MTNTILLADDSVTIQKVIELTFMDEDYEVVAVGNGDEALDQLEELTPDVVIADVHMPGASGYDVARRAKQLHPQAPVLLLVGTFEPFDDQDYEGCGADGYLKKPFDSQELLQRVSDLMAARAGMAPSVVETSAAPPAEEAPASATDRAAGPTEEPAVGGDETRSVPTWEAQDAGAWRPGDEAGEDVGLGTRRMPTFEAVEEATEEGRPVSGWDLTGEPEEVAAGVAAEEEQQPAWAGGEPFEPVWESVDVPAGGGDPDAAAPSWALEETGDAASGVEPEPAAADLESRPPPATPATVPPPPAVEPQARAVRPHHGDPFPELAQPQAAGAPAATGTVGPEGTGASHLSDADVDRVARRLVELLGDDVIREVAWEVVPDLAEVVIKDRLRELEKQLD